MTFSDEDLKRLKERLDGCLSIVWQWKTDRKTFVVESNAERLNALLARMEAAEALLFTPIDSFDQREKLKDAWRKAAGKEKS